MRTNYGVFSPQLLELRMLPRLRVFEENNQITDIEVTLSNRSAVNLALLAIDRLSYAEKTELM